MDDTDRALINALQGGFPLVDDPWVQVGAAVGIDANDALQRVSRLLEDGVLTRFGPMFQIERMGGAFCLAAMAVPEARFVEVTNAVNALPEVAHNYRRDHPLNMWFVLATERPEGIGEACSRIEVATGLAVFAFPKEREFFVDFRPQA